MSSLFFLKPKCVKFVIDDKGAIEVDNVNNEYVFEDVSFNIENNKNNVKMSLKAQNSLISHVYLYYPLPYSKGSKVFGDTIERGYGDMGFYDIANSKQMFWYFFLKDVEKQTLDSFGVHVQPKAIVSFKVYDEQLFVDINTQCGGSGTNLAGRKIELATFEHKQYYLENVFESCRDFLNILMGEKSIRKLSHPAYGFNNWYYAYGESNYSQIIKDTDLLMELTRDIPNKPYMVIDDGWSIHSCSGSWINDPNKFPDMAKLAKEISSKGAIPGIWFRPLKDIDNNLSDCRHPLRDILFDPTCLEVIELIKNDVSKFVKWGYELIKIDFITVDIFLNYGFEMDENLCPQGFKFKNNNYTNAEIILNMYNAIRETAKDAVLIGCNAIGHLCAGIFELNRIGDDTSGFEWERTRKYGVNSLAYKLIQNNIFYSIDADCVGIMDRIDWEQNKEWLNLLAISGSPLFVSFDPDKARDEIKKDVREAFLINHIQNNKCEPLDMDDGLLPSKWIVDDKIISFDWFKDNNDKY